MRLLSHISVDQESHRLHWGIRLWSFLKCEVLCQAHMIFGRILIFAVIRQRSPCLAGCSQGPLSGLEVNSQFLAMWPSHTPLRYRSYFSRPQGESLWPLRRPKTCFKRLHLIKSSPPRVISPLIHLESTSLSLSLSPQRSLHLGHIRELTYGHNIQEEVLRSS